MASNPSSIIPFGRISWMSKEYRGFYVGGSEEQPAYYIISRKTFLGDNRDYRYDYALFATRDGFNAIWAGSMEELASGQYEQQMFVGPSLSILINEYLRVEDLSSDGGDSSIGGGNTVGGATSTNQMAQTQALEAIYTRLGEMDDAPVQQTPVINGDTPLEVTAGIVGKVQVEVINFPVSEEITQVELINPPVFPTSIEATITNFPAFPEQQTVIGSISVNNFPSAVTDQLIHGSVSVSALPPIGGTVALSNLPTNQLVTISNPVSNQTISGTVAISNLPTNQSINGSVSIDGEVAIKNSSTPLVVTVSNPSTSTGASTSAKQDNQTAELVGINSKLAAPLHVVVDNPTTTVTVSNPVTTVAISNPVTSVSITGSVATTSTSEAFLSKVVTSQLLASSNIFSIKSTAGNIKRILVGTTASASRVVSIFNKATSPTGTDVPIAILTIPASPTPSQSIDLNINCSAGIQLVIGNTVGLLGALTSILGLNDCVITVLYT